MPRKTLPPEITDALAFPVEYPHLGIPEPDDTEFVRLTAERAKTAPQRDRLRQLRMMEQLIYGRISGPARMMLAGLRDRWPASYAAIVLELRTGRTLDPVAIEQAELAV